MLVWASLCCVGFFILGHLAHLPFRELLSARLLTSLLPLRRLLPIRPNLLLQTPFNSTSFKVSLIERPHKNQIRFTRQKKGVKISPFMILQCKWVCYCKKGNIQSFKVKQVVIFDLFSINSLIFGYYPNYFWIYD